MRWPIRFQVLWPFASVVTLSIVVLAAVAATRAARRSDEVAQSRLEQAVETLAHLPVPYTEAVLQRMRGLSGAEFVACDAAGRTVASTLPEGVFSARGAEETSRDGLKALSGQPTLAIGGVRYYVARFRPRADPTVRTLYLLISEETWGRARRDAAVPPLMVGGTALVMTLLVSVWLAERFGRRLRRLQERVACIAAGDFRQIPLDGPHDEIQDLVGSVNQMASQLQQLQETIRRSERTRLVAQLASGLAHQLRNAVTGAKMALELHRRRCRENPGDQSLDVALRQLAQVEIQVKGLLSAGNIERRAEERCDVSRLLDDLRQLLEPTCEHSGISLAVDVSNNETLAVTADRESLLAALLNIALNAVEAARSGGHVTLRVRAANGQTNIEVLDDGNGPLPAVAATLFEPFVTTKPEGIGLGLALARQAAIEHGGTLTWHREANRTVFRLSLPAAPAAAALGTIEPSTARDGRCIDTPLKAYS